MPSPTLSLLATRCCYAAATAHPCCASPSRTPCAVNPCAVCARVVRAAAVDLCRLCSARQGPADAVLVHHRGLRVARTRCVTSVALNRMRQSFFRCRTSPWTCACRGPNPAMVIVVATGVHSRVPCRLVEITTAALLMCIQREWTLAPRWQFPSHVFETPLTVSRFPCNLLRQ